MSTAAMDHGGQRLPGSRAPRASMAGTLRFPRAPAPKPKSLRRWEREIPAGRSATPGICRGRRVVPRFGTRQHVRHFPFR